MTEPDAVPPPSGSHETDEPGVSPAEEPTTTGTLFIMMIFLMALAGMWVLMYFVLLGR
jgi:hypothetical protein